MEVVKMKRITYSAKYYIVDSILTVLGLTISMITLFVLDECVHWLIWLFYVIFTIISILGLFLLLWNIQWINIDNRNVSAHNIFGTVKRIEISEIKEHIAHIEGVLDVHHIHIWSMDGYNNYATMHIVTNADHHEIKEKVREELEEHGIVHATLELEAENEHCHEPNCVVEHHEHSGHHHHHHHH
jgi:cobalt-zinc-cadmium efflux system protein